MAATLNLSNEVVKMRAEVKRVKVLVLRKLTRQITTLKIKKGAPANLEKNQRRIARLLEEIHELKTLAPDSITKAALQRDISFEKVCQNKASLSERAMARVATHPEFSKRIRNLKDAVKAFKDERISAAIAQKKAERESKGSSVLQQSGDGEGSEEEGEGEELGKERNEEHEGDIGASLIQKADVEGITKKTKQDQSVSDSTKEKCLKTEDTPPEVVRMRKEVKKLRILVIRKLTQMITSLRTSGGKESETNGNQQCITRLKEEVQVLRSLLPDHVTTTVLQGKIDFENVLQDPKSSSLERASARIVTHPRFFKKLQEVRKAIEEERTAVEQRNESKEDFSKVTEAEDSDGEDEEVDDEGEKDVMVTDDDDDDDDYDGGGDDDDHGDDDDDGGGGDDDDDSDDHSGGGDDDEKRKEKDETFNVNQRSNILKQSEDSKSDTVKVTSATKSKGDVTKQNAESSVHLKTSTTAVTAGIVKSLSFKSKETPVRRAPPPPPGRKELQTETKKPENRSSKEESESDLSDGDEEKEYFDDSTEERFHKLSSQSEESDDDDFFLGKVSKLKKKKSDAAPKKERTSDPAKAKEASDARPEFKMQSVFCSTLSKSSVASQKGKRYDQEPPRLHNHKKSPDCDAKPSWFKSQDPRTASRRVGSKGPGPGQRTAAGSRFGKQPTQANRGGFGVVSNHPQQNLHPSWEASRKRKEQQAQIAVFQGKKIKFDD